MSPIKLLRTGRDKRKLFQRWDTGRAGAQFFTAPIASVNISFKKGILKIPAMEKGWIKLHRIIKEKPIWLASTPEQKTILITILLMANHEENEWEWKGEKFKVLPGQFVTSLESIRANA